MNTNFPMIEPLESRIAPAVFTVTNLNDTTNTSSPSYAGSLRAELAAADAHGGFNTIQFHLPAPPSNGENTITLAAVLTTAGDVTITGPGAGKLIISGAGSSGVFRITGSDHVTTISGLSIVDGESPTGAGVYSSESLTLKHVVISGNSGEFGAGAVDTNAHGAKVKISNSLITANTTSGFGGGLDFVDALSVSITDSIITGNTVTGSSGGGIYASVSGTGAGIAISGCLVSDNSAYSGGGLYLKDGNSAAASKIVISKTAITGNSSTSASPGNGGGGLSIGSGNAVISGSTISNNRAVYYGGGIRANGIASLTISKSLITGNQTTGAVSPFLGGGGLFIEGASSGLLPVTITGSQFTGNQSTFYGGGIFAENGVKLTISGSSFSGNRAEDGGALLTDGSGASQVNLSITKSVFTGNVSIGNGGAINGYGSGVVSITASNVTGNIAKSGAGIFAYSTTSVTIKDVVATGNFSSNIGGGMTIYKTSVFKVTGGTISGNTSVNGGGVYVYNSTGTIKGVTISDNAATTGGGGVFNGGPSAGAVTIQAATVTGNSAPADPDFSGGGFTFV